ncbi:MAG: cysteine synthase A [Bdellovibrio sp.]
MKTARSLFVAERPMDLIGNTPLLKIKSLSELTGCEIFIKCEFLNPGGSIKDRAAKQMVEDALEQGRLKSGMTIVEGTAGNTGIGLALVAKSLGLKMVAVMPKGQTLEKERMIELFGAKLVLVDAVPFANENHFYHTARRMADDNPSEYWWANQFENTSNFRAHYLHTGPEILEQMEGRIDALVSVAGTGGTIGGNSAFLKEKIPNIEVHLIDPEGSGLCHFVKHGEFKSSGSSFTEGIGIMRLVENFKRARVDEAVTLPDSDAVAVSRYVRDRDGLVLGSSSALNVAGALRAAVRLGPGKRVVTFACDLGERSYSKLYNLEFLQSKGIDPSTLKIEDLITKYKA